MAQTYYTVEKAAEVLGVTPEDVKQMRERQELHGYRDGATWKFKAEDVDRVAQERREEGDIRLTDMELEDQGDVLLSEHELGQSGRSSSGTVIGREGDDQQNPESSDIQLVPDEPSKDAGKFDDLDLTINEDLTLDDSTVNYAADSPPAKEAAAAALKGAAKGPAKGPAKGDSAKGDSAKAGDSALDLSAQGEGISDEDLVLGGSGSGSDVTIGSDSGISLVDPADSGLSLEEPLELSAGAAAEESLELGEDDILTTTEEANLAAPAELKADDDFLLTPLTEGPDEEDSESGSQVIALDTEGAGDEAATMIGGPATASMVAMLDEDTGGAAPLGALGVGAAAADARGMLSGQPMTYPDAAALAAAQALPETPYSVWSVLSLAGCVLALSLTGMMMYELVRNMWSWETGNTVPSSIMDFVVGLFEKTK